MLADVPIPAFMINYCLLLLSSTLVDFPERYMRRPINICVRVRPRPRPHVHAFVFVLNMKLVPVKLSLY